MRSLRDFPATIYCESPEASESGKWVVRGELEAGLALRSEHESLIVALARFGQSYYALRERAALLNAAKSIM